ncbi:MAG TPA: DUF4013 domain-containing protein [Candidatus Dormibacteraeota bacterium]|nr:DUF4013 domain-containing protein [Candidatus Dormibacteraeota bacterium]
MNSPSDWFGWAFRDPQWPTKVLVQGLIVIIPIVGWIAMTGWLLMAFENAHAGRNELPPAGFHLERGIAMFGVFLIYGLVLQIPAGVLYGAGAAASSQSTTAFNAGSPLSALGFLLGLAGSLFLNFLVPSLIINTYHRGFAGGMDVPRVWEVAAANLNDSLVAGLIVFVVSFLGGLGFLCCIGFIFTIPYQNTVMAAVAAWIERVKAAPPAPAAPAA